MHRRHERSTTTSVIEISPNETFFTIFCFTIATKACQYVPHNCSSDNKTSLSTCLTIAKNACEHVHTPTWCTSIRATPFLATDGTNAVFVDLTFFSKIHEVGKVP